MKFSKNMFNSMIILRTRADFFKWNDKNFTAETNHVRNYAEFYSPLDLFIPKNLMKDILQFSTGQACEVSGGFYWYDDDMSVQKLIYSRALGHYR